MFSSTVLRRNSLKSWKMTPILRRSSGNRVRAISSIRRPATHTSPSVGRSAAYSKRSSVVFTGARRPGQKNELTGINLEVEGIENGAPVVFLGDGTEANHRLNRVHFGIFLDVTRPLARIAHKHPPRARIVSLGCGPSRSI